MDCPQLRNCRLFPLFQLSGALSVWKTNYCAAEYVRCERYKLSQLARPVPDNLLPNGKLLKKDH